jgi:hypothetical protein
MDKILARWLSTFWRATSLHDLNGLVFRKVKSKERTELIFCSLLQLEME